MNIKNWESFFDAHAPHYMNNGFTKNTISEVDFVIEELKLSEGSTILDVGCGTGRHSIELAKRGYKVTGIDISSGMLLEANKLATEVNVSVEWVHCDAAFGLVGRDEEPVEHDLAILKNISDALKPKGRFILTNLECLLENSQPYSGGR